MSKFKLLYAAILLSATTVVAQTKEKKEEKKEEKQRDIQVTFITPLGTNGLDSYKTTNKVSLNIFAGVSGGLKGVELGGFANVIMNDVYGLQMAGFSNVVLGNVTGVQYGGFTNYSGGNLLGVQFAGFTNFNLKDAKGAQLSGFLNTNMGNFKGGQLAGFANYNHKDMRGVQGSGFVNVNTGNFQGAQMAGFGNVTVGDVKGVQLSGFFNYARKVKGIQLSFLNIADSVDGASIGFLSIVRKGLHQVEVSTDELSYSNVSIRTGTHRFYNIFSIGMAPMAKGLVWNLGYGVGTSFRINDKLRTDVTLSAHHINVNEFYSATSELYKLYWGVEYKLWNKCFIAAGPTFNMYLTDALLPEYTKTYSKIAPYNMFNFTNSYDFNLKGWVGGRVAIRFL